MRNKASKFILGLSIVACAPAMADYYNSVDEDTCWDSRNAYGGNCIEVETEWKQDDKLHVYYNNTCEHRLYIKMCNERKKGGWDCGASGISGNGRKLWYTYDATGRYEWISVGVTKGSMDWVCAGKVRGWRDVGI